MEYGHYVPEVVVEQAITRLAQKLNTEPSTIKEDWRLNPSGVKNTTAWMAAQLNFLLNPDSTLAPPRWHHITDEHTTLVNTVAWETLTNLHKNVRNNLPAEVTKRIANASKDRF